MAVARVGRADAVTVAATRALRDLYLARRAEGYQLYLEEKRTALCPARALRRAQRRLSRLYPADYHARYEKWKADLGWVPAR